MKPFLLHLVACLFLFLSFAVSASFVGNLATFEHWHNGNVNFSATSVISNNDDDAVLISQSSNTGYTVDLNSNLIKINFVTPSSTYWTANPMLNGLAVSVFGLNMDQLIATAEIESETNLPFTIDRISQQGNSVTFNFAELTVTSMSSVVVSFSQSSPVPIPATAWLFGSALAGLLVARRNK
ncbi:VPLPA-CTERM sorting domain-containing protein [Pseudomonadales bacterium]|nr:VPLPA-CTERM sorting domain-containing protein [Pseudomonadales bacterium]